MRTQDYDDDDDAFDERGILRDGRVGRMPLMMRDAIHNDLAGTGHRPGFSYTHDATARARVNAAHERYEQSLCDAWHGPIHEVADEQTDLAISDAAAHTDRMTPRPMEEVYRLYDEALRDAWKTSR